jgi:hypothetical protein
MTIEEPNQMNDTRIYQIEVQGQVDENELNATSPIHMQTQMMEGTATRLIAYTDQSGLIGLIRYLHSRGMLVLSINRKRTRRSSFHEDHSLPTHSKGQFTNVITKERSD